MSEVSLRIEGRQLPGAGFNRIQVGVQRRTDVEQTVPGDAATATFSLSVDVVKSPSGMDFRGPYVQGRKGERFLYLSWGLRGEDGTHEMFRRAKLHLSAIDTSSVERAVSEELPLVGALALTDEQGEPLCASVRPPQITWEVDPLPAFAASACPCPRPRSAPATASRPGSSATRRRS